jgi:DNA mismatch endonuclease (patch repair protein)
MTDVFSQKKRSEIMARVKGRGNHLTELRLMKFFRAHDIAGWRRNSRVFGRPDFVFPDRRIAVFVDGCFWHGCPIHGSIPKTNRSFWNEKLARNKQRDQLVNKTLKKRRWKTVRIWQHELRDTSALAQRLRRIFRER